ncbi:MAG: putative zinc-binding protein [Bacteriovoracaceae bacterium]|jgi:uncharacterized metal-binding protein|nr:putative zinc-binding protein [Bacteriovoracaceae bacterium]
MDKPTLTVYSCSGCSNVAQLANRIAVNLDRNKLAKMSCIAGIGAGVPSLVNVARNSEKILVIDGCPIACAKKCMDNQNINIDKHLILTEFSLKKNDDSEFDEEIFTSILSKIKLIMSKII